MTERGTQVGAVVGWFERTLRGLRQPGFFLAGLAFVCLVLGLLFGGSFLLIGVAAIKDYFSSVHATYTGLYGLEEHPALMLAGAQAFCLALGLRFLLSFDGGRRFTGVALLLFGFFFHNGIFWYLSTRTYVSKKGEVTRYVADTPDGPRYSDRPGFTPEGYRYRPVDRPARWESRRAEQMNMKSVNPDSHDWFEGNTGNPLLWHGPGSEGAVEFFPRPGFHPGTGKRLEAVTPEFRSRYLEGKREARRGLRVVFALARFSWMALRGMGRGLKWTLCALARFSWMALRGLGRGLKWTLCFLFAQAGPSGPPK